MTSKILCVDDDPNLLAGIQRNLRKQFELEIAIGGEAALLVMEQSGPYAVVVADMQMPGMNGVELLKQIEERWPETVRVMLTGNADQNTAVQAVNEGHVFRFLNKPCPPETLGWALEASLQHYKLVTVEKELLEKTLNGSIRLMMETLSMIEPDSFGRAQKLRDYMRSFLKAYKTAQAWELEIAAMLSQIGWVAVPANVRQKAKQGALISPSEQAILMRVPDVGFKLLTHIPRLEGVCRIVKYQDKNFDGTGYPQDDVAGESIPLGARILKVLSNLLLLEEKAVVRSKALEMMQKRVGCYDGRILDAAFACFDIYLTRSSTAQPVMQAIRLRDLQAGQVLLSSVMTNDNILIVPAGAQVTSTLLERLRNFAELSGIKEPIYVEG
jgi:response regulator RpfG family c-di-GMP phosphodiesterase